MTFKDIALKNFKFNARKYFAYFLCTTFSIIILFMYGTLLFNNEIVNAVKETVVYTMMMIAFVVVGIFSLFFISYSQSSFMKSRSKEFGLFLTLGMTKKDINRIIVIENLIVALISLTIGLMSGTVFSRLFYMVVVKLIDIKDVSYNLNYKSYVITAVIFLSIHIFITLITKVYTSKLEIVQLIRERRKVEFNKITYPILGIISMISVVLSFVLFYLTIFEVIFKGKPYMMIIYVIVCIVGLYITISQFGAVIIRLTRSNKNMYFKRLISLSEINHKFIQYKRILYILCILSAVAVFFIGFTFVYSSIAIDITNTINPFDIMYIETLNENKLSDEEVNNLISYSNISLVENISLKLVNITEMRLGDDGKYFEWGDTPVISDTIANEKLKIDIDVTKGNIVGTKRFKEKMQYFNKGDILSIKNNTDKIYSFTIQEEIYEGIANYSHLTSGFAIILDEEDYNEIIKDYNDDNFYTAHLFNFKNWKDTEKVSYMFMDKLNEKNDTSYDIYKPSELRKWKLRPRSKILDYNALMMENRFNLFVMCFIGLLCFISTGVVLYFKIFTDLEYAKERYKKLFKIGITDKEMIKAISRELKLIFFIPVILGCVVGFGYLALMMSNQPTYFGKMLVNSLYMILLYLILQTVFYLITKRKYIHEIIE